MSKTFVQLGRIGDLLNILPFLYHDSTQGIRHKLMVAKEYASLLEGVSYLEPIIYEGPHYEIGKAVKSAQGEVCCTQVNGPQEEVREYTYKPAGLSAAATTSYQKEQWKVAGRLGEWDSVYALVFDVRDRGRENRLLTDCGLLGKGKKRKPVILVSTKGNSSKFPYADLLLELLKGRFGSRYHVIELPHAERFYDLLALYETAHCLVATDSAPLHLARACPNLPVIALCNDGWKGSVWEPNHVWFCRYSDFPERAVQMLDAMECVYHKKEIDKTVSITHTNGESRWDWGVWHSIQVHKGMYGRNVEGYPYVKDCIRMAIQRKDERIFLFRDGTCFTTVGLLGKTFFANRITKGDETFHPVTDLFGAPTEFWKKVLEELPNDLAWGKDYWWSHCLWAIFKKHGAVDATGICYRSVK